MFVELCFSLHFIYPIIGSLNIGIRILRLPIPQNLWFVYKVWHMLALWSLIMDPALLVLYRSARLINHLYLERTRLDRRTRSGVESAATGSSTRREPSVSSSLMHDRTRIHLLLLLVSEGSVPVPPFLKTKQSWASVSNVVSFPFAQYTCT